MALWSSGALYNAGHRWGPLVPPVSSPTTRSNRPKPMKHADFYPDNKPAQPEWHNHFASRITVHGPALPLTTDEVDNAVADNLTLAYGLGNWITNVREYGPACTAQLEDLRRGTGNGTFAFLTCVAPTAPTLPVGADPVRPGALQRTFDLVAIIKRKPGYTETIGLDLGIIGPEAPPPPPAGEGPTPRITVTAIAGDTFQYVRCKFIKDGHQNVAFQCRRGNGDWEDIVVSNKSPFIDNRPLLVSTQAEIREFRARFVDNNLPSSDWCAVVKVTVSP